MVSVVFTGNLKRHVQVEPTQVEPGNVGRVLGQVFEGHPKLRSYVLDDQGGVRKHVTVFVNGEPINDRNGLSDQVPDDAEVYVAQALSGG